MKYNNELMKLYIPNIFYQEIKLSSNFGIGNSILSKILLNKSLTNWGEHKNFEIRDSSNMNYQLTPPDSLKAVGGR